MNSILPLGRRGKNFNFSFKYRPGLAWPLLLLLSLGLVACAHTGSKDVVYQQGRKTVRLVPAKDVKNCEIIATLIGETRSGETAQAKYDLLRRIARVGGNCGVIDDVVKQGKHVMAHGQGYRCRPNEVQKN